MRQNWIHIAKILGLVPLSLKIPKNKIKYCFADVQKKPKIGFT